MTALPQAFGTVPLTVILVASADRVHGTLQNRRITIGGESVSFA